MRSVGTTRQVGRLGATVACLVTAATVYFWPLVGPSPSHTITSDLSAHTYPWRRYVTQELFAGRLPQWTPYAGFGFPLLADIETTVFYPVSLLGSLVSGGELSYRAVELESLLHYVVAGLGMFLFLGRTGLGWAAAMVGALTLMFSGFFWAHVAHVTIVQSASWVPWVLLGAARLLERPTGLVAAGTGLALALSILGGHPQIAYLGVIAFAVVLLLARPAGADPGGLSRPWRVAGSAALAVAIGVGLSAVQLLPTTVLARYSYRWAPDASYLLEEALPPENLLTLLVPLAFRQTARWVSVDEFHGYIGILPLVLALWALVCARDRWTGAFAVLAGTGLLAALAVPPFASLGSAGIFRVPARALLLVTLGVAALAARGAQALGTPDPAGSEMRERGLLRGLWVIVAAAVGAALWLRARGIPGPLAHHLSPDFARYWDSFAALLIAAVLAMTLARRARAMPGLAQAVLIGVLVVEALNFPREIAWSQEPPTARWRPQPELVAMGRAAGPYRVALTPFGHRDDLRGANAGIVHRVPVGSVYSSLAPSVLREFDLVMAHLGGDNVYPLMGTRWILSGGDPRRSPAPEAPTTSGATAGPRPAVELRQVGGNVWEVADPLPRAYLPARVRIMEHRQALRTALQTLDPRETVLVQAPTPCPARTGASPGTVTFVKDDPDQVVLRVWTSEAGPLVLSDSHYRGWRATVDGQRAPVLRANLLFRMVCVPAGEHMVEFRFRQPRFHLGLAITATTALGAVGLGLAAAWRGLER